MLIWRRVGGLSRYDFELSPFGFSHMIWGMRSATMDVVDWGGLVAQCEKDGTAKCDVLGC